MRTKPTPANESVAEALLERIDATQRIGDTWPIRVVRSHICIWPDHYLLRRPRARSYQPHIFLLDSLPDFKLVLKTAAVGLALFVAGVWLMCYGTNWPELDHRTRPNFGDQTAASSSITFDFPSGPAAFCWSFGIIVSLSRPSRASTISTVAARKF